MSETTLFLGNKRYSSWSLRGWLACKLAELPFKEVVIGLDTPETAARILAVSPSGRVPCLHHQGRVIWDSLAIGEYCAELKSGLWPADMTARARARVIAAEMHSGFVELRRAMFLNLGQQWPGKGRTPGALADIARITKLWTETRAQHGASGRFLFGRDFTLADAAYAPIVCRFDTWRPELTPEAREYADAVWAHPFVAQWVREGRAEALRSPKYEIAPA